ncbi:nucleotide-binding alpha-beta plait domain-containing protein [Tanacetum coccineum]
MRDKETLFFFTNFLESWDTRALWKVFSMYGKVVDVYVAFKRTKKNTRFGFVRFINIGDIGSFERKLKWILIAKTCYKVYGEEPDSGNSFMDVVVGQQGRQSEPKVITIKEDKYLRSRLENCWVGLSFLFEWNSKDSALNSLEANKIWMQQWFDDLKLWEDNGASYGRLSWLIIEGLPPLTINLGSVRSTLSIFGKILEVGSVKENGDYNLDANMDPDNDNDLSFEEEFVGPSMMIATGVNVFQHDPSPHWRILLLVSLLNSFHREGLQNFAMTSLCSNNIKESLSQKHGLVSNIYFKKSLIIASIFGFKAKFFLTMSIPSQDGPLTNRPMASFVTEMLKNPGHY